MNSKEAKIKKYALDYGMSIESATYFINKQEEEIAAIKMKCDQIQKVLKKRIDNRIKN